MIRNLRNFPDDYKLDRTGWPEGPWMAESDYYAFEYKGYTCNVIRMIGSGVLNGYIEIPKNHPIYEFENYDDVNVIAHGGINFGGKETDDHGNEWYVIGFDTAHSGDFCPGYANLYEIIYNEIKEKRPELIELHEKAKKLRYYNHKHPSPLARDKNDYKNIDFVKNECEKIVDQLIALEKP